MSAWTNEILIPDYRTGEFGNWRIVPGGRLLHEWGYYSAPCIIESKPCLMRRSHDDDAVGDNEWRVWMSLTPHEIESQELACHYATGHTVIMGLGMGWVAANIASRPEVDSVIVVELDPDVIALVEHSGALRQLPVAIQEKIEIQCRDALNWRAPGGQPVDFLYADIWLELAEPQALDQVRLMQLNIGASQIYYWGQEFAVYSAAKQAGENGTALSRASIQRAVHEVIRLPLLIPDEPDYAVMVEQVVRNRISRGLPYELAVS